MQKRKVNSSPFFWEHFFRNLKFHLALSLVVGAGMYLIWVDFYQQRAVLTAILLLLVVGYTVIVSLWEVVPMQKNLDQLEKLYSELPWEKYIELVYHKNEWGLLGGLIELTAEGLQKQDETINLLTEQSQILLESIPSALVTVDSQNKIKLHNSLFKNTFLESGDTDRLTQIFPAEIQKAFEQTLTGESITLRTVQIIQSNRYYDVNLTPLKHKSGEIYGALGIFHDVSQLKLAEKMKVDFVANVSHEIKTPLTSIKGYSQFLVEHAKNLDPQHYEALKTIHSNVEKFIKLFENIMELSKIESLYRVDPEKILLSKLINKSMVLFTPKAKSLNKKLELDLQLEQDEIWVDADLFEQVFHNLVSNAIKYAHSDIIHLKLKVTRSENNTLQIRFSDNGPGVAEEELPRLFERFYRAKTEEKISGNGLGLALVKHIVTKHQGSIKAEKATPQGLTIIMDLPLS